MSDSQRRNPAHEQNGDAGDTKESAASARQKALAEGLGIDTYARFPRELIEYFMDVPPEAPAKLAVWKPIHDLDTRVYYTIMRYSWCWPICLSYAVVTDFRDEIRLEPSEQHHLLLSQEAIAKLLGRPQQRVNDAILRLVDLKTVQVRPAPGRTGGRALYLTGNPHISEEERKNRSTPVSSLTGLGEELEPKVYLRFSNLLNKLPPDDALISLPPGLFADTKTSEVNGQNGGGERRIAAGDLRTLVWERAETARTTFKEQLRKLAYSQRKAYSELGTEVTILIARLQSPDIVCHASSSSIETVVDARTSPPTEGQAPAPRSSNTDATTTTSHKEAGEDLDDPTTEQPQNLTAEQLKQTPKDAQFYAMISRIFTESRKGTPTIKQLAAAWKVIPADADLEALEAFLSKSEKGKPSRVAKAEHAGILLTLAAEFAGYWTTERAARAQQPFGVRPRPQPREETRQEKILALQGSIEMARAIANDKKYPPDERARQADRLKLLSEEIAALNGNADAVGGGS